MADIMRMGASPTLLGSWDLDEMPGREITLVIDKIVDEKIVGGGQTEVCTVCYWTDKTVKKMVLNVTNKKCLCKLYKTKDTEKLRGKAVTIGVDKVKAFGDVYDALRIRPRIPKITTAAAPKCEQCKRDIAASGNMNAEQVAAYTAKKYGKQLCAECATAIAKGAAE